METELLYLDDSYLRTFTARVVAVEGEAVALDRTAFYPGGGGQLADHGWLRAGNQRWTVSAVTKRDGLVWHTLTDGPPPAIGTAVEGEIDWDFRYQMMRTHTALHILCGVIFRTFGALVTGNQMYPDRARMDFTLEDLNPDRVAQIEQQVNAAIVANRPVTTRTVTRAEAEQIPDLIRTAVNLLPAGIERLRLVEIEGIDLQADGGTHVRTTGEVGAVRIVKVQNKGKNNKRIEIVVGTEPPTPGVTHVPGS